jgi:ATP-binding cassette subfamily B protein
MNIFNNKWFRFFAFKKSIPYLISIVLCLVLASILGMKTPELITNLSKNYNQDELFYFSLKALLFNFLIVYVNRVSYSFLINKYVRMLIQNARVNTFSQWIKAPELSVDKYPQGEIISRIMSDTEAIRELITSGAFGVFIDLSFVISSLFGFINIHRFSGIVLSAAEILATILLFWGSSLMRDMFMKLRNSQAKVNRVTANVMGGFHQVYYTNHQNYSKLKSQTSFNEFLKNQHIVNSMDAFYYALAESLYPILLSLVILIFPYSHITEAAIIFAIVDLIQRSINPIKEISGKIANIQRARAGIERISQFLEDVHDDHFESNYSRIEDLDFKEFEVNLKHFAYPQRENERESFQLENIGFKAKKGQLVGIVGMSGSGKSTFLNILTGTLKASNCEAIIRKSNEVISIEDFPKYLKEVSLVSQESHIFTETLQFNITLSYESVPDFIQSYQYFEENIPYLKNWNLSPDTIIHPEKLSLGQRQLLAGIRALYLKKNIVFFDEISSALDPELELSLRNMVLLIQKNSLTIIVAHRVETIISADLILVLKDGRLLDSGIHSELTNRCSEYLKFIEELSHS